MVYLKWVVRKRMRSGSELNKIRNIGQKAGETCKSIFNWAKKIILPVLLGAGIILTVVFLAIWRISGISDTLYIGTIGTVASIFLVGLQLSIQIRAETRAKKTCAHNAKVIELLEETVELQRAKNKD